MMSICGQFWRSTGLAVMLLLMDAIVLVGGLSLPVLESFYWLQIPGKNVKVGLWNPSGVPSLNELIILWVLRLFTMGRMILAVGFIKLLTKFHALRYTCVGERMILITRFLLIFTLWKLLLGIVQLATFWFGYLTLIVDSPSFWKLSNVLLWFKSIKSQSVIGPAPLMAAGAILADSASILMVFYYRNRRDQWQKFNTNLTTFFT